MQICRQKHFVEEFPSKKENLKNFILAALDAQCCGSGLKWNGPGFNPGFGSDLTELPHVSKPFQDLLIKSIEKFQWIDSTKKSWEKNNDYTIIDDILYPNPVFQIFSFLDKESDPSFFSHTGSGSRWYIISDNPSGKQRLLIDGIMLYSERNIQR